MSKVSALSVQSWLYVLSFLSFRGRHSFSLDLKVFMGRCASISSSAFVGMFGGK